jgi:fibronectin-binding autotransporter adhesin
LQPTVLRRVLRGLFIPYNEILNLRYFPIVVLIFLTFLCTVSATDTYWTNKTATGDFTNGGKWSTGAFPVNADSAYFTNLVGYQVDWTASVTNANAFFNVARGGATTTTQAIGSSTWFITNNYIISQNAGNTGTVTHTTGTLVVTNSTGSGIMVVGRTGRGTYNLDGGTVIADQLYVTNSTGSTFNFNSGTLTLQGNAIITNNATSWIIGNTGGKQATFNINAGTTTVRTADTFIGGVANSTGIVTVTGSGTLWSNAGNLYVGQASAGNQLLVSNGAIVKATAGGLVVGNDAPGNILTIDGSGSAVHTEQIYLSLGAGGSNSTLRIHSGGALVIGASESFIGYQDKSNLVVVAGSGSTLTSGGNLIMGENSGADNNRLIITNGGVVTVADLFMARLAGSDTNSILVSGSDSVLNANNLVIGNEGSRNQVIISNGGMISIVTDSFIAGASTSTNNTLFIADPGSIFKSPSLYVGNNGVTAGTKSGVVITNGGTLEVNTIVTGSASSGSITNFGGVYQFTSAIPTITTNTGNSLVLTNGTVSFKGVVAADINTASVARITFQGQNTFQLNNSTGRFFSAYTFGTNNGNSFQHLTLVNSGTRWQATNTTINSGGIATFSNTIATLFGTTTNNAGTMRISATNGASTTITFEKSLVVGGIGDGSGAIQNLMATNTISAPMTLMGNATISSASGKLTVLGAITNGGNTLTVGGAGNITLVAPIAGTGGLAINGGGTVIITNSAANAFSGATTITNSTVTLSKAGALGSTSGITLSSAGTLLLDGGAIDRIGNTSGITLDGGAITVNNQTETVGTLTLLANSTITLNYNGTIGDLTFSDTSYTGGTLTVVGWNGTSSGGGDDRIFFTSNSGGANMLNNITFQGFSPGAQRLGSGEIIPLGIPEPASVGSALLLVTALSMHRLFKRRSFQFRQ